jgi:hypothetical protein
VFLPVAFLFLEYHPITLTYQHTPPRFTSLVLMLNTASSVKPEHL